MFLIPRVVRICPNSPIGKIPTNPMGLVGILTLNFRPVGFCWDLVLVHSNFRNEKCKVKLKKEPDIHSLLQNIFHKHMAVKYSMILLT